MPDRKQRIVISVDAMGGDQGPAAVVAGLTKSVDKNPDVAFILHGPEEELTRLLARRRKLDGRVEIRNAAEVVSMEDRPSHVMRHGQGTSMWSTLDAVRVFVSQWNTTPRGGAPYRVIQFAVNPFVP